MSSSLNRKSYNSNKVYNNTNSKINSKLNLNNFSEKKKHCSSSDIKLPKEGKSIKLINYTTKLLKDNKNKYDGTQNPNKKIKNKPYIIQKKNEPMDNNNNKILNKNIKKGGLIESYPSIISTDTLTIKNNNINLYKKNATEFIISFNCLNKGLKKDSSSNFTIKNDNNIIIENNENKINKFIRPKKLLSDLTTAEKNENSKNFTKSEKNDIKKNNNRFRQNINQKDIDKIKLDIQFDNNSAINEIDSNRYNTGKKEKKNYMFNEPEFIKEIKEKNNMHIQINNSSSLKEKNNNTYSISLDYSSNTTKNKKNMSNNKFNLDSNTIKNDISNYRTYFKDLENNNYFVISPINSTFKQINSRKNNRISKIFGNVKQLENINEDDIDTVKQENTFGSKIESITSETCKDIQTPKNCVYFFDVPEEQNYNHIQGPIEFNYDNSSDKGTINNKDDFNCSKLNNIHILKLEKKDSIDDDNINYFDIIKENDDIMPDINNDIKNNINNNNNNIFSSISSLNDKTISNNCSFNNININNKKNNNNNLLIKKERKSTKNTSRNNNDIGKEKDIEIYKKVKSYQKKIIKNSLDLNKAKSFKTSTKINRNFSEKRQKELLLFRLKNYKIEVFVRILQKIINNNYRKIYNKFKNINMKMKQFILLVEKIYISKNKNKLMNILVKYINKKRNKKFPFFIPFKNYPFNNINCNIINIDNNNNQTNPVSNDNDTLNNSCNIYYENNNNISSSIRNNLTQNEIKKQIITKSSGEKTDSYFYIKKLIYPKNTIPFSNINNFDRNDYIKNKKITNYKKQLIPKQNSNIPYNNIINNFDMKINKKNEEEKKTYDSVINNQNNNIDDNDDEIMEQAYKFKLLDEDRCSNGNLHRNKDNSIQKKNDLLKEYFLKEVEKLEFPDVVDSNRENIGEENVEKTNSF